MRWYLLLVLLGCISLNLMENMVNYGDVKSRIANAAVFVIFLVAVLWYYFNSGFG